MFAMSNTKVTPETPRDRACAALMEILVSVTGRMVNPHLISEFVDAMVEASLPEVEYVEEWGVNRVHPL